MALRTGEIYAVVKNNSIAILNLTHTKTTTFTELKKLNTCIEKKVKNVMFFQTYIVHTNAKELLTTKVI